VNCAAKLEAVRAYMNCINSGNYEAATAYLHHDIEIVEPTLMPYAGRYRGHAEFIAMMRAAMRFWMSWRDSPYPYELACVGDVVFREHRVRAEVRSNGEVVEMHFLEVAEFRGDKIARIRPYYFDPAQIHAAAGRPGPSR
jgi:ketosteroid isomerase-like protein